MITAHQLQAAHVLDDPIPETQVPLPFPYPRLFRLDTSPPVGSP